MVERLKITHFYTAPTALRLLLKAGDEWVQKYDRSSLKTLACGERWLLCRRKGVNGRKKSNNPCVHFTNTGIHLEYYSVVSRPSHVFNVCEKIQEGLVNLVMYIIRCNLRCGWYLRPFAHAHHGLATWLTAWASGQKYITTPQAVSNYITRSIRPSDFFSRTLKSMGRPGYQTTWIGITTYTQISLAYYSCVCLYTSCFSSILFFVTFFCSWWASQRRGLAVVQQYCWWRKVHCSGHMVADR